MNIRVVESVLKANDAVAAATRQRLDAAGLLAVNVMSAPGSGKTELLEATVRALAPAARSAIVVGDLQTTRDAERLSRATPDVVQINTGTGCHLVATQVGEALASLPLTALDYLFIENVGNMVCPAAFDLGEHRRVALLSVPEGDDKVAKYPTLFQPADAILLTKVDLAGVLDYDRSRVYQDISRINSRAPVLELSARTGAGMPAWLDWLRQQRASVQPSRAAGRAGERPADPTARCS